jgi:hypothetical protein
MCQDLNPKILNYRFRISPFKMAIIPASFGCPTGVQHAGTNKRSTYGCSRFNHSRNSASSHPHQQSPSPPAILHQAIPTRRRKFTIFSASLYHLSDSINISFLVWIFAVVLTKFFEKKQCFIRCIHTFSCLRNLAMIQFRRWPDVSSD